MAVSPEVKRVGSLSGIYLLGGAAPTLVGMLILPVITRYLSADQLGLVRLARRIAPGIAILLQLGLVPALRSLYLRLPPSRRGPLLRTSLVGLVLQVLAIGAPLVVLGLFAAEWLLPNITLDAWQLRIAWGLILLEAAFLAMEQMGSVFLQLEERAVHSELIKFLRAIAQAGLGLGIVVLLEGGGLGRQLSVALGVVLSGTLAAMAVFRGSTGRFVPKLYARSLRTGITFVPHRASSLLGVMANSWILTAVVSSAAMGLYGIAMQFTAPLRIPAVALANASYPTVARLMGDGSPRSKARHARIHVLTMAGLAAVGLGLGLAADLAIRVLTTAEFQPARRVVPILVLGGVIDCWASVLVQRLFYHGRGIRLSMATALSTALTLGLSAVLIPRWGIEGAAWALFGGWTAKAVLIAIQAERTHPLPWPLLSLGSFGASVLALGTLDAFLSTGFPLWLDAVWNVAILTALAPLALLCGIASRRELAEVFREGLRKAWGLISRMGGKKR